MGLMKPIKSFLPIKWVAGGVLIFLAWQGVVFTQLRPREYTDREKLAIERVCEEARAQTDAALKGKGLPIIGLTHLIDDPSNYFTTTLATNLSSSSIYQLQEGSVAQQFFAQIMEALERATSIEEIVFAANNVELDLLASGRVMDVREEDKVGYATLNYLIYDVGEAKWMLNEVISADSRMDPGGWLLKRWKLLVALLLIGLTPWLCFKVVEKVVEKNSNAASAGLVAGFMLLDILLLWWAGFFGSSMAVPIVVVLVALVYNLWACDFMAKKME
jgi:hypothetical protein